MSYKVKEIYLTIQGEGINAGKSAVFCRFSGCNLWSGRESDREKSTCWFCDTDFVGTDGKHGGSYKQAIDLSSQILSLWPAVSTPTFVVFTGGEPALQLDHALVDELKRGGAVIAVETNGSIALPDSVDWVTVSPKPKTHLQQTHGNELKLVYPGLENPDSFSGLDFEHFLLSPRWDSKEEQTRENIAACIKYCKENPRWRLSIQQHKIWGIP